MHDNFSEYYVAFSLTSSNFTFPFSSQPIGIIFIPQIYAVAGLVPWADTGTRQIFLLKSPLLSWYFLMDIKPAYSPVAPLFGWEEI